MPDVQNTQGGAAKAPPIPNMDVSPPPAATVRDIRNQARDIAREVRAAAQDARQQAQSGQNTPVIAGSTVPAPPSHNDIIPPQAVDISLAFFFTVAACVIGFPIARAFARLIDRKSQIKAMPSSDLTPQIRQLQDSVDAMAIELERISEGQRFTAKLLADRSSATAQQ